jgi:hypothetical protein
MFRNYFYQDIIPLIATKSHYKNVALIPWELVADPLGSAKHTLRATVLND